jgi:hypothetical protein
MPDVVSACWQICKQVICTLKLLMQLRASLFNSSAATYGNHQRVLAAERFGAAHGCRQALILLTRSEQMAASKPA